MLSDETFPTLQHLTCHQFARWLCQQQIKRCRWSTDSYYFEQAFFENCKTEILITLNKNDALLPKICRTAIAEQVEFIMDEMRNEMSNLDLVNLIGYIFKTAKWQDFVFSWWSRFWRDAGEEILLMMFERVMIKSEEIGLDVVPEDELSCYMEIWKRNSKLLKFKVFENLSRAYTRTDRFSTYVRDLFNIPRDLQFLTKLFADFTLSERLQIWVHNWQDLIYGVNPMYLEPFMRMCCESDEAFQEFKGAWLSKCEIIENYYCLLIDRFCLDELEELMYFYAESSSSYEKVLQLAKRTIHTFFIINPLPKSYDYLISVAQSGRWLGQAIRMPEFEYLMRADIIKLKVYCYSLIQEAKFNEIFHILNFFLTEQEAIKYEKQFTKSFFLDTCVPFDRLVDVWLHSEVFHKLNEFNKFIEHVFPSVPEATSFKKEIIYSQNVINSIRHHLRGHKISEVNDFVRMCLSSEQEISEWEDAFLRDNVRRMRNLLDLGDIFCPLNEILAWCTDTAEKASKFKSLISIDEAFEIISCCSSSRNSTEVGFSEFFIFEKFLKLWYPEVEERINFKLQKLREYPHNDSILWVLLCALKDQFRRCDTDDERYQVIVGSCQI